jgi:hypothetical protein
VDYNIYDEEMSGVLVSVTGDGTAIEVDAGAISDTTVFYIETIDGTCTSISRVPVTVPVHIIVLNYPDIRIEACPYGSSNINLSKYIDTLGSPTLSWSGLFIDPSAGLIGSALPYGTYTYKYSVTAKCLAAPINRKVYVHSLHNNRVFFPRDTIYVCREHAEALQINQIFGVEAEGEWSTSPDLMTSKYIHQSPASSPYAGAVVFNGKAAYDDGQLTTITYKGTPAKAITFYYDVPDGCLKKNYKVVIVISD